MKPGRHRGDWSQRVPGGWPASVSLGNCETCRPAATIRDAPLTTWAAPPGCGSDRPRVSPAGDAGPPPCPNAVCSGPAPAGSGCAPANRGCVVPGLPRPLAESAPSSRIQTCCRACCNSTLTEKLGFATFVWNSSHKRNALQLFSGTRYVVRCNWGCWNRSSFNVTPVHSAAPTAMTDFQRCAKAGRPSSAWMRDSKSPIHFRILALGPNNFPGRNTGYA